jgi:hypothetical protein
MSSPMSSRLVLGPEFVSGLGAGRVVGDVVLPAVPDDVKPGAGPDADGVGVVVTAGSGAVVVVGGPWVGQSGVGGEVGDRVAELFVAGPTESDSPELAGLSGRGGGTGQAGQRLGCGESRAAVADLGEQSGGTGRFRAKLNRSMASPALP